MRHTIRTQPGVRHAVITHVGVTQQTRSALCSLETSEQGNFYMWVMKGKNTSETPKTQPGPVWNHQLGSENAEHCACMLILSQDELLMLHLLLCNWKTAPLLDWKYLTETFNNLCFLWDEKIYTSADRDHLLCFNRANWSQSDKCAACLFIYLFFVLYKYTYWHWNSPCCAECLRAALCRGNNILIYNSVCVFLCFPELQRVTAAHPEKHYILKQDFIMGFPCLMLWFKWNPMRLPSQVSFWVTERPGLWPSLWAKNQIRSPPAKGTGQTRPLFTGQYWPFQCIFNLHSSHLTGTYSPILFQ